MKRYLFLILVGQVFADGLQNVAPPSEHNNWFAVPAPTQSLPEDSTTTTTTTSFVGNNYFQTVETIPPAVNIKSNLPSGEVQIGNSFFESGNAKITTVRQFGAAYEDRVNLSDFYLYYNQLLSNNIFYEGRVYLSIPYQTNMPNFPTIPISNKEVPLGYGFVGILGYLVPLNGNVSIMPFLRLTYYNNFAIFYNSTSGNSLSSNQYLIQPGARLSMKINNVFATYVSYWAGYQATYISGGGLYANGNNPELAGFASTLEVGFPYKMTRSLSLAPYLDYNVSANNPNNAASQAPYNGITATNTNLLLGLKLGYEF